MPPDTGGQAHGADIRCRNCGDITVLLQTLTIRCWHSLAEGLMQDRGAHTGSHSSTLIRNSLVAIIPNARARHRLLTRFAMPGASPSGQGWTPETGFSNGSLSGSPGRGSRAKSPARDLSVANGHAGSWHIRGSTTWGRRHRASGQLQEAGAHVVAQILYPFLPSTGILQGCLGSFIAVHGIIE